MKKNGFVFLESIVVLVVTMLALTLLLISYSLITRKAKEKEEYDRTSDKYLIYNLSNFGTTDLYYYGFQDADTLSFKAEKDLCKYFPKSNSDKTVYVNEILSDCEQVFKDTNLKYLYTIRDINKALQGEEKTVVINPVTHASQTILEPTKKYDNGTVEYMKTLRQCKTQVVESGGKRICNDPIHYLIGVYEKNNRFYFASIEI
ncbi:MAG: type II secretion system protein [Bacilli bacterium]|jgi:hypothetical protein|nr:type II secretion system protein [Bacilli bacterium]